MPYDEYGGWYDDYEIPVVRWLPKGSSVTGASLDSMYSQIVSGGTAIRSVIADGGLQRVLAGGIVQGTIIRRGGVETLQSGGSANGGSISSGGQQNVFSGIAEGASVLKGGLQAVSGGKALRTAVKAGGRQTVVAGTADSASVLGVQSAGSGGVVRWTRIGQGGSQVLHGGGRASSAIVSMGASQFVSNGGSAVNAKVLMGGVQNVYGGGRALGGLVSGMQFVDGGAASDTTVDSAGMQSVINGGQSVNAVIGNGGTQVAYSRGLLRNAKVSGMQNMYQGGSAIGGTVFSGGFQSVQDGLISAMTVKSGGWQYVGAGGSSIACTFSGGSQSVSAGIAKNTVLLGGGQFLQSGAKGYGTRLTSGSTQSLNSASAWGTVVGAGCEQDVGIGGFAQGGSVSGVQNVLSGGTAAIARILSGGTGNVFSGALMQSGTASSGAAFNLYGSAVELNLRTGVIFHADSGTLGGANIFGGLKEGFGSMTLAKGASLGVAGRASMSELAVAAPSAALGFSAAGTVLKSLSLGAGASVLFDLSKTKKNKAALLTVKSGCDAKGKYSAAVLKEQGIGTYRLANGVSQTSGTAWNVVLGGKNVGQAKLDGGALGRYGVNYRLKTSGTGIVLQMTTKIGAMVKGTSGGETLEGTGHSDIFYGSGGNDVIKGVNGRDCAVYGNEYWGKDKVLKTAGTMAIVFKDIAASAVTSSLSGTTMTFAKKAAPNQTVTVEGWNSATHSAVFGGTMTAFRAWAGAASPTSAQTSAMRSQVWKAASLA